MKYYLYAGEAYYDKENGRRAMTFYSRILDSRHERSCRGTASGQLEHWSLPDSTQTTKLTSDLWEWDSSHSSHVSQVAPT